MRDLRAARGLTQQQQPNSSASRLPTYRLLNEVPAAGLQPPLSTRSVSGSDWSGTTLRA